MNEITQIHLGRQPFTISVEAHKELQAYVEAIKKQVGSSHNDVVEEVEIRMAELLTERGVVGDKVVLPQDVAYLKEQLGTPADFKDDDTKSENEDPADSAAPRRLFRDTQTAMLGGVSSGIAAYFNIDAVIVRILFVIATFAGGWGIALYIVLWLIVPEAKTSSDRLQMRGKAVTVDSIKEAVDRADVTGAAHRASRSLVTIIGIFTKALVVVSGAVLATIGTVMFTAIAMVGAYAFIHNGQLVHGAVQFPLGTAETVAVIGGLGVLVVISLFTIATGVAMVRRKWSVPGWGVAAMITVLLAGVVACGAALPDTISNLRDRYRATSHTELRQLQPFERVEVMRGSADVPTHYENVESETGSTSSPYSVEIRYLGDVNVGDIKTYVRDGTLVIDARDFKPGPNWDCDGLCIGAKDYFAIVLHTPRPIESTQPDDTNMSVPIQEL